MRNRELVVLAMALWWLATRRRAPAAGDWEGEWHWPVPRAAGAGDPIISNGFAAPGHLGVDVMYRVGGKYVAPEGTHVLAARAGTVFSTGQTARGWNVVLDHGKPWATFYQHLAEEPLVKKGDRVEAGQQIGVMGADPTDPQGVRHLHFATWYKGAGDQASVDPAAQMSSWTIDQ